MSDESHNSERVPVNQSDFQQMAFQLMTQLPHPAGSNRYEALAQVSATLKATAADFKVYEELPFSPGESANGGEHLLLRIRKSGLGTAAVQRLLAQFSGHRQHDVGYCGLKDVNAVTEQWFSVPIKGIRSRQTTTQLTARSDADCCKYFLDAANTYLGSQLDSTAAGSAEALEAVQYHRKLRPGTHSGNRFVVILRQCEFKSLDQETVDREINPATRSISHTGTADTLSGVTQGVPEIVDNRLESIKAAGFPNYFGLQRFGHAGSNLRTALHLIDREIAGARKSRKRPRLSRQQKMAVSAFRSLLFNVVCARRVRENTWLTALPGEPLLVGHSRSFFIPDSGDAEIASRLSEGQIFTSAPLVGTVASQPVGLSDWWHYEREVLHTDLVSCAPDPDVIDRFSGEFSELFGLRHQRRAMCIRPETLDWLWLDKTTLQLTFELPPGSFATALLGNVCCLHESNREPAESASR